MNKEAVSDQLSAVSQRRWRLMWRDGFDVARAGRPRYELTADS
jgi:hypothetical protein